MTVLFRPHRGGLKEAMNKTVEINSKAELIDKFQDELNELGIAVSDETICIKPYEFDDRTGWETHIVLLDNYGVLGFTNGNLA